jgi:hypothetical protein
MKLHKDHSKVVMDYNWLCTFNINNEYVYTAWQKGVNTHIARFYTSAGLRTKLGR